MTSQKHHLKKLLLAAATLGVAVILLTLSRHSEPIYRSRTITAWIRDWTAKKDPAFWEAVENLGTNVIPYVVRNLAKNDSWWRRDYARLHPQLPSFLQRILPTPKPLLQDLDGANVFFHVGSNSIPQAIALLSHKSPTVRRAAAVGLVNLRRQSPAANQAIPALIAALRDNDRVVRLHAITALTFMGADATNAIPALTMAVAHRSAGPQTNDAFAFRAAAAAALGMIGPQAATAMPALKAVLQESDSYLRGQAAVAIWRISSDVDVALPVLLREMPSTSEYSKGDWIAALGEMGPRAKAAVPQLRAELQQDREEWVLMYVTNALKNIGLPADPDPAAK